MYLRQVVFVGGDGAWRWQDAGCAGRVFDEAVSMVSHQGKRLGISRHQQDLLLNEALEVLLHKQADPVLHLRYRIGSHLPGRSRNIILVKALGTFIVYAEVVR